MDNKMKLVFPAISENEQFARTAVIAFIMNADPTVEQITDVKTAVSEAVTNSVVHGYPDKKGEILIECELLNSALHIKISDFGVGINNVEEVLHIGDKVKVEIIKIGEKGIDLKLLEIIED